MNQLRNSNNLKLLHLLLLKRRKKYKENLNDDNISSKKSKHYDMKNKDEETGP